MATRKKAELNKKLYNDVFAMLRDNEHVCDDCHYGEEDPFNTDVKEVGTMTRLLSEHEWEDMKERISALIYDYNGEFPFEEMAELIMGEMGFAIEDDEVNIS